MYSKLQIDSVKKILQINKTNYWTGNEIKKFEKEFSRFNNTKYSIAVSNGSVALEIALKSLNLEKNSSVIVTPRSFIISASCVINVGLNPVFSDVDENGNRSIDGIKHAYYSNKNIKAIILVHLNGLPCDLLPIIKFSKKNKLYLIEDCSQAHGAVYQGKPVGCFADVSTWSFCQDKIISTGGEGGMISTNSMKIWQKCWSFKEHGKNYNAVFFKKHKAGFRWTHDFHGSNYRLTEMQAAIGRHQLKSLSQQLKRRNKIANLYLTRLKVFWNKFNLFKKPNFICESCPLKKKIKKQCNNCKHSFYRLNLFVNSRKIKQIDFIKKLNKKKISCSVGPCPEIYNEKIFKKLAINPNKKLSNTKLIKETSIVFPINPFKPINIIKKEINTIGRVCMNIVNL